VRNANKIPYLYAGGANFVRSNLKKKSFLSWGVAPNPKNEEVFSPVFFKKLVGFGLKAQGLI